jgi:hypothetical protein
MEIVRNDFEIAKAILSEAISGGFLDEMPATEEEVIEVAQHFAKHAQKEYNAGQGDSNETIVAIVNLSQEPVKSPSLAERENGDGSGSSAFAKEYDDNIEMPFDISVIGDQELRRLHGIFAHYFGRVRFELAQETAKLTAAEHLRDDAFRTVYVKLDKIDMNTEKPKSLKQLDAEAMESSEYISWNRNVREHEKTVLKLKALAEIYSKNVEVLSREATIRQNEYERNR